MLGFPDGRGEALSIISDERGEVLSIISVGFGVLHVRFVVEDFLIGG